MGIKETVVCFSIVLLASATVLAQEASTQVVDNTSNSAEVNNSSRSGPPKFPSFDSSPHSPPRHKRSPEQYQGKAAPRRASCSNGARGSRCRSCHEVIECLPGNRAVIRRCSGSQRYCNRGRCSSSPGGKCHRPSTSSTSPTSTTIGTTGSDTTSSTTAASTTSSTDSTSSTTDSSTSTSTSTSSSTTASTTTTTEEEYSD